MLISLSRSVALRNIQLYALRQSRVTPIQLAVRFLSCETPAPDIRTRLRDDLKQSMRSKNSFRATTVRSVLAEITNADKANKDAPITQDSIYSLLHKSIARRNDSATQFRSASRPDLASKEDAESELLSSFLPPQLTDVEVEDKLRTAFTSLQEAGTAGNLNSNALVGKLLKSFYETTERASVKADAVSKKAREIVQAAAKS
ncbi:hypothetical protein FRC08_015032 [Ceratobasidium sp. 394]|nr:hypothetical protein FRC08_015032 [Ceratobasidium sp. 394]KAG9085696.1 hypothetical protein FS749_004219 [Ceratobasidium sp. UAMH 11750]